MRSLWRRRGCTDSVGHRRRSFRRRHLNSWGDGGSGGAILSGSRRRFTEIIADDGPDKTAKRSHNGLNNGADVFDHRGGVAGGLARHVNRVRQNASEQKKYEQREKVAKLGYDRCKEAHEQVRDRRGFLRCRGARVSCVRPISAPAAYPAQPLRPDKRDDDDRSEKENQNADTFGVLLKNAEETTHGFLHGAPSSE